MRILRASLAFALAGLVVVSGESSRVVRLERTTVPVPSEAVGIGPGARMRIQIPGEAVTYCTTGFIFKDTAGNYYASTAGHCLLPVGKVATHGSGADYDASGVKVGVLERDCVTGGCRYVALGSVVYARQSGASGEVGNDFGLVALSPAGLFYMRPELPVWGGPYRESKGKQGDTLLFYGQGTGIGETLASKARSGLLVDGTVLLFQASGQSSIGDSGAPVVIGKLHTTDLGVYTGDHALGIVTHGIPGGTIQGTTIARAKSLVAVGRGLDIRVVMANN